MIKISIIGPESSGKSTLGVYLSRVLECSLTLEYAREYLNNKNTYVFSDLRKISIKQHSYYNDKIKEGGNYLVSDTCLIDIEVWSEIKYKKVDKKILELSKKEVYDIYILCSPDIPWYRDKLRENPENRDLIFEHFRKKISTRKLNYHIVKGSLTERLMSCLDIIYKMK